MDARTIQKEVLLGEPVSFLLRTGQTLQGVLVELSRDCATIESEGRRSVILLDLIGALQTVHNSNDNEAEAKNPASDNARSDIPLSLGASDISFQQAFPARVEDETADKNIDDAKIQVETVAINANQGNGNGDRALNNQTRPLEAAVMPLLATQAKYEAQIRFARFEPEAVDFQFPTQEIDDNRLNDARTAWQNIKSIYDYAVKVQEMDPKHGRIGRFAYQLERLSEQYSEIQTLRRQAAHAAYLSGQIKNSLELWKKVAFDSDEPNDWKNVAAVARTVDDPAVCCYAGGKYYTKAVITEEEGSWFIFINLIHKFWNYSILPSIIRSKKSISSEEQEILFEAGLYLLTIANRIDLAEEFLTRRQATGISCEFLLELFEHLPAEPTDGYQQVVTELEALRLRDLASQRPAAPAVRDVSNRQHKNGVIRLYKRDKNYGFINANEDGRDYFFHLNSVSDPNLVQLLADNPQNQITVRFLAAKGDRGLYAYDIEIPASSEEMATRAVKYADATDYQKAAFEMRKLLSFDPDYPNGQELYSKWNRFAAEKKVRGGTLPKGSGYYSRAKCADIVEHDRERAVQLYRLAIQYGDRTESAVKDLATMLGQMGKDHEAIKILNDYRDQAKDPRTIDGILMTLYQKTGETDKAIPILYEREKRASNPTKRAQILGHIANLHMSQQQFELAEEVLRRVLSAQPDNTVTKRHLALCLLKRSHLDEAEKILNEILEQTTDVQAIEVLTAVQQARTGASPVEIDILISNALSDFFTQISAFAKFFLDQCDYKGVPTERIQAQNFHRSDVERLEESATVLGSRLPRDRGSYYLSAAKIDSMLEDSDPNRFYRYLCRSFFSMGDAIVQETGMLDSACDFYCESLAVFDNDHSRSGEQDAANALIRVLYATLGADRIPSMIGPKHLSIDEALEIVIGQHPDRNRVYRYIDYLIYRSRFAAARVLTRLYRPSWRSSALEYLRSNSVEMPEQVKNPDDFARLWNVLRQRHFEDYRFVTTEFRFLTQIEIASSSLEDSISRLPAIGDLLFFDLDKRRLRDFQIILESAFQLCLQSAFEERERYCLQAEGRCRELIREIETSPTKFSIEQLLSVLQSLQQKLNIWIEDFYQRSTPSLSLHLAIDSYSPEDTRQIEVEVAIENESGRSPAESIELIVVSESEQFFSTPKADLRVVGSLRGGERATIFIPLQLTAQALNAEAFSMNVFAQYRTRSDQGPLVVDASFSIQLTSEFDDFPNPYHVYAYGGVVTDASMFYGRGDMIKSIVHTLATSPASKSIVLYGQRRSGKSSILHHLNEALTVKPNILVVNIENIGSLLDPHSATPLLYQILWTLLKEMQRSIRKRVDVNNRPLAFSFPSEQEFVGNHAPLGYFNTIFEEFKDCAGRTEGWENVRVVLLIDEFSYIYGYLVRGTLSQDFMVNWKALLQRNHFSAVLAGQDVMPKFIARFPNEWGTTQPVQIGYLNEDDSWALIDEPIRIGGKNGESRYREEKAIERIIELTAGNPFYVQIICNKLVEYMKIKRKKFSTKADVERIRDGLIRGIDALKLKDFENLISSGDKSPDAISEEDALAVLKSVALNTQQVSTCAGSEITAETVKPVLVILEDLVHRNVLECERGSFYRIRVGLFKEWLMANS